VLDALLEEEEIGILCFPVRPSQIQRLRVNMAMTDNIPIGTRPWGEDGPDLAFLRLPPPTISTIESIATIVNGDLQRQNIRASDPDGTRKLSAMPGVVAEMTKPATIEHISGATVETTSFEALLNVGNLIIDDDKSDRFRFQPVTTPGATLPTSYKGTSGAGLWQFYFATESFSLVQARLIGVAYWEKPVGSEIHGPLSIYETLFYDIRRKFP
jgi:hypothetical protein